LSTTRTGGAKVPVAVVAGDPDAGVAEADDVDEAVAGGVGEHAGVLLDAPAAGVVGEVVDDADGRGEGPVAVVAGDPDAGVAEADDVDEAVAGGVGEHAGVLLDAPAAGVVGEVVDDADGRAKVPSPLLRETQTPASPKPTTSGRPSPVVSASMRGCRSTRHPPAVYPKFSITSCMSSSSASHGGDAPRDAQERGAGRVIPSAQQPTSGPR
jgi:hypothetical protein